MSAYRAHRPGATLGDTKQAHDVRGRFGRSSKVASRLGGGLSERWNAKPVLTFRWVWLDIKRPATVSMLDVAMPMRLTAPSIALFCLTLLPAELFVVQSRCKPCTEISTIQMSLHSALLGASIRYRPSGALILLFCYTASLWNPVFLRELTPVPAAGRVRHGSSETRQLLCWPALPRLCGAGCPEAPSL